MNDMMWCVGVPAILAVFMLVAVVGAVNAAPEPYDARGYQGKPLITHLFTMDGCGPCERLKERMKHRAIHCAPVVVTQSPPAVDGFPSVCYTLADGSIAWDNGQRIYKGDYRLPEKPVVHVHWSVKH